MVVGRYNADINTYLNSESSTKYLSPDVQNEKLKVLSQMILQKLIAAIKTEFRILTYLYAVPANNVVILLKASYLKKVYLQQYLQINANTLLTFNIGTHLLLLSRKNVE